MYFPRHFKGGLKFKTLCADCNSKLGGREDMALQSFFEQVRKLVEAPILLGTPVIKVVAKPNLLFRGLMAHLASANDSGMPCAFDDEAREVYFSKGPLGKARGTSCPWLYLGQPQSLHDAQRVLHDMASHGKSITHVPAQALPACLPSFAGYLVHGVSGHRKFICPRDEGEAELPIQVFQYDADAFWPATRSNRNIILGGGDTFGLVGSRS